MPQTHKTMNRRQTMPFCREDSERLSEFIRSRENLQTVCEESEMKRDSSRVAPPRHRKRGLNRSDSYRAATAKGNSISMHDSPDFRKDQYKKEQYKSLPSEMKSKGRIERGNKVVPKTSRVRVLRQESGVVPSPDTDDDQQSVVSERKKKTTFQKAKERLIHTFRKQSETADEKLHKKREKLKQKKRKRAPSDITQSLNDITSEFVPSHAVTRSDSKRSKTTHGSLEGLVDQELSNGQKKSKLGRLATLRNSFSKNRHSVTERKKPSDTVDGITHNTISDEKKESDVEDISTVDEIFSSILFGEVDKSNKRREEHVNRRGSQSRARRPDVPVPSGLGDRSQLSLDINSTQERGRQRGTLSPDGSISRRVGIIRLHSDVEVDGGSDEVEGATARERKSSEKETQRGSDVPFHKLSLAEQERRTSDVAERLKRLADKYIARIDSESGQSDLESPRGTIGGLVSPVRHDIEVVEQLVAEFRKEGDRLSKQLDLESNLTPLILKVAQQATYASFKTVINQSLRDTIGWDQIAMYYYVTKTAVHVAGASKVLANMTVDYFRERYSEWIKTRGGWESMIEETDSELD